VFVDHEAGEKAWKQTKSDLGPADASSSGSGGHFVYDRDQMHAIAQAWTELASDYLDSIAKAEPMRGVVGPGNEYASDIHARDANTSGVAYIKSLTTCAEYCKSQMNKYKKALGEVVAADDESHRKVQQSSSPLDGGI
jgi:hypothetical protein